MQYPHSSPRDVDCANFQDVIISSKKVLLKELGVPTIILIVIHPTNYIIGRNHIILYPAMRSEAPLQYDNNRHDVKQLDSHRQPRSTIDCKY